MEGTKIKVFVHTKMTPILSHSDAYSYDRPFFDGHGCEQLISGHFVTIYTGFGFIYSSTQTII
jgi:hypothetical protein